MDNYMDSCEKNLIAAMELDHGDEAAKVHFEEFLATTRPQSIERHLLRLEREIAQSHTDQLALDGWVDEYIKFRTEHSNYFWDNRGGLQYLFRSFKVWLVSFAEARRFAVEQALRLIPGIDASVNLDDLPVVIQPNASPDGARSIKERVVDFIRRYKGPTGREPEVQAHEITLAVTPTWIDSLQT